MLSEDYLLFFFSSRRRHTRLQGDWSSDVCSSDLPSATNIRRYAEIVRERSILRKLVTASDDIATNAFNPQGKTVDRILDEAEQKILAIGEEGARNKQGFQSLDTLVVDLLDRDRKSTRLNSSHLVISY